MTAGEVEEPLRADTGVVDHREGHQVHQADIGDFRAEEEVLPCVPVAHHVVDAAAAVLETAVPDPDVHGVPVDGLDAHAAAQEAAANDLVLRLSGRIGAAEDDAALGVAQDQIAGLVVGGEVRSIAQTGLRAAAAVEGQSRKLGVPGIPLEHRSAFRAVPAEHDAGRIFADHRDHVVLVGLARRFQGLRDPVRPGGQVEHAGPLVLADLVQCPLQGWRVVGLAVAGRPEVAPHVEPARKRPHKLLLGRKCGRSKASQEYDDDQEGQTAAGRTSEISQVAKHGIDSISHRFGQLLEQEGCPIAEPRSRPPRHARWRPVCRRPPRRRGE